MKFRGQEVPDGEARYSFVPLSSIVTETKYCIQGIPTTSNKIFHRRGTLITCASALSRSISFSFSAAAADVYRGGAWG